MHQFAMFVTFEAAPGARDDLVGVLLEAADVLGGLPECVAYLVCTSPDDADAVSVMEVWSSREAHAASLQRDDVRAVIERGRPLIAGMGVRVPLAPAGGKLG